MRRAVPQIYMYDGTSFPGWIKIGQTKREDVNIRIDEQHPITEPWNTYLLLRVGVFNRAQMNDAILKFRRYEDSSLAYTGVNRHAGDTRIGTMDSSVPIEAIR